MEQVLGLHADQLIIHCADADLLGVFQADSPVCGRADGVEVILPFVLFLVDQAAGDDGLFVAELRAGRVQSHRVERSQDADIRDDGGVVLGMAVAEGRDLHDKTDMEMRTVLHYGLGVFGHLHADILAGMEIRSLDRVEITGTQTTAAAHTLLLIDICLAVLLISDGVLTAVLGADLASFADALIHRQLARAVLLHLAGAGTAAHAQILDSTAHTQHFMCFEVVHGDDDIRVHDCLADLGVLYKSRSFQGNIDLIRPFQTVADDHLTSAGIVIETVLHGAVQMIQGVLAHSHIKSIAVRQERLAALGLDDLHDRFREIGPQIAQIAGFTEMDLDGGELVLEINRLDPCFPDQFLQLLQQIVSIVGDPHIRKINFTLFHSYLRFNIIP